jgi:hypothetical protein
MPLRSSGSLETKTLLQYWNLKARKAPLTDENQPKPIQAGSIRIDADEA